MDTRGIARHSFIAGVILLSILVAGAQAGRRDLPPKAAAAISESFPNGRITEVEREHENGVMFYEVSLRFEGRVVEVEVTQDGGIGEIEEKLGLEDLPDDVRSVVAKATQGAKRIRIEKHERRGRARSGRYTPLPKPTVNYEVKYVLKGRRRRLWLSASSMTTLPDKAKAALKARFPKAVIGSVELGYANGIQVYEVELMQNGKELELLITPEGTVVGQETEIRVSSLPPAVRKAAIRLTQGGRITEAERVERYAVITSGRLSKLREPRLLYEVEVKKGDREAEMLITPEGRLVGKLVWEEDDDDDDEDDDD